MKLPFIILFVLIIIIALIYYIKSNNEYFRLNPYPTISSVSEPLNIVCFSGGGLRAFTQYTGFTMGLLRQKKIHASALFKHVNILSSNAGGSSFLALLCYSKTYNNWLEQVVNGADPKTVFNTNYTLKLYNNSDNTNKKLYEFLEQFHLFDELYNLFGNYIQFLGKSWISTVEKLLYSPIPDILNVSLKQPINQVVQNKMIVFMSSILTKADIQTSNKTRISYTLNDPYCLKHCSCVIPTIYSMNFNSTKQLPLFITKKKLPIQLIYTEQTTRIPNSISPSLQDLTTEHINVSQASSVSPAILALLSNEETIKNITDLVLSKQINRTEDLFSRDLIANLLKNLSTPIELYPNTIEHESNKNCGIQTSTSTSTSTKTCTCTTTTTTTTTTTGSVCKQDCPKGWKDLGTSCQKPPAYNRGAGYGWKIQDGFTNKGMFNRCEHDHGKGNCEEYGSIVYPKCKNGFHSVGCCICSPDCPKGFGSDTGIACAKKQSNISIKTGPETNTNSNCDHSNTDGDSITNTNGKPNIRIYDNNPIPTAYIASLKLAMRGCDGGVSDDTSILSSIRSHQFKFGISAPCNILSLISQSDIRLVIDHDIILCEQIAMLFGYGMNGTRVVDKEIHLTPKKINIKAAQTLKNLFIESPQIFIHEDGIPTQILPSSNTWFSSGQTKIKQFRYPTIRTRQNDWYGIEQGTPVNLTVVLIATSNADDFPLQSQDYDVMNQTVYDVSNIVQSSPSLLYLFE